MNEVTKAFSSGVGCVRDSVVDEVVRQEVGGVEVGLFVVRPKPSLREKRVGRTDTKREKEERRAAQKNRVAISNINNIATHF